MTPPVSFSAHSIQKLLSALGLIFVGGWALISCTPGTPNATRGIASETVSTTMADKSKTSDNIYGLSDMNQTIAATHSSESNSEILGGFLAATAEDILESKDLGRVISANADRACVFLAHIHGKKHKHAVSYKTNEQVGPMMSPETGQLTHQRALPISKHEMRKMFCDNVAQFDPKVQQLYTSRCLGAESIEVMPLHFTTLECDNPRVDGERSTHKKSAEQIPLYPNYHGGSSPRSTR